MLAPVRGSAACEEADPAEDEDVMRSNHDITNVSIKRRYSSATLADATKAWTGVGRNVEHCLLGWREVPDRTSRQIAQSHSTNINAHESEHLCPDGTEQAPDLAVSAFVKDDLKPSVARTGTEHLR